MLQNFEFAYIQKQLHFQLRVRLQLLSLTNFLFISDSKYSRSGLYSFFNNYDQECLRNEACQENIVEVTQSEAIYLYALSTKASEFMVTVDNVGQAPAIGNGNTFCSTLALFEYP